MTSNDDYASALQRRDALQERLADLAAETAERCASMQASEARRYRAQHMPELMAVVAEIEQLNEQLPRLAEQPDYGTVSTRSDEMQMAGYDRLDVAEYRDGEPLRAGQSFDGFVRARGGRDAEFAALSLRKYLRGVVTGDWQGADAEKRAMAEGTLSSGGYLLPTILSAQIVDLARNQTRVLQAGARIVPMANKTVTVPKWASDPTMAWHSESAAIPTSDATIGAVTLTAQTLTGLTTLSRELLEDADGIEAELRAAFAAQLALKLDLVALYGTGTAPEPRGVKNTTGVTKTPLAANGATPTNYDFLINAVGRLQDVNEDPNAAIMSPRTARELATLKDTTNQPLQKPAFLDGVQLLATNQVPNNLTVGTGTTTSDVFVADWRQLFVGVRTELQIQVLSERYADTGSVGVLSWYRGDVAVARAAAFDVTTGVL